MEKVGWLYFFAQLPCANCRQSIVSSKSHDRQSTRLPDRDYTAPGLYFVTICTENRVRLFGDVVDDTMHLSAAGKVVLEQWSRTAILRPYVALDHFVVMPDHFHAILAICFRMNALPLGTAHDALRLEHTLESPMTVLPAGHGIAMKSPMTKLHEGHGIAMPLHKDVSRQGASPAFGKPIPGSLGAIIGGFKSAVTYRINAMRRTRGTALWQRNYDDRIIRNRIELEYCRRYIDDNPRRWAQERGN